MSDLVPLAGFRPFAKHHFDRLLAGQGVNHAVPGDAKIVPGGGPGVDFLQRRSFQVASREHRLEGDRPVRRDIDREAGRLDVFSPGLIQQVQL